MGDLCDSRQCYSQWYIWCWDGVLDGWIKLSKTNPHPEQGQLLPTNKAHPSEWCYNGEHQDGDAAAAAVAWRICTAFRGSISRRLYKSPLLTAVKAKHCFTAVTSMQAT